MHADAPPVLEVVLVGGGHSHVQVLRSFGMRPPRGVRVTVISREVFTPYSGMLPGHVAGFYDAREIHIDLGPLARFADARLIADEAIGLDAAARAVHLAGRPPIRYDVLSINSGAAPVRAGDCGVSVKPIGRFLPRWREVQQRIRPGERIVLVGGGAGGVELALAMRRALDPQVVLTLATDVLLPGHNARATRHLRSALATQRIELLEGFRVASAAPAEGGAEVIADDGRRLAAAHLFWVTAVAAPAWLGGSGLALDGRGFVRVDAQLRSISHPEVFAAGDVAAFEERALAKAGVYAVREGPVLTENLRRVVLARRLVRYRPQRRFLTIIGTGDGRAVAARGEWAVAGRWVWHWKNRIDRRFMRRFQQLPQMADERPALPRPLQDRAPSAMRCGGCGAKLGAEPLHRALARLPDQAPLQARQDVRLGIGDDAAVMSGDATDLLLTVDGFCSLVEDPYLFGRIGAHHSLNDVFAMGGEGRAAVALVTLPLMAEAMMEEDLYQLLAGAVSVLNEHGVPLVGGHSAEGRELMLALTVIGALRGARLGKGGARPGDVLVLNKPLGTGAVLAGFMRGRTSSDRLAAAVASMDCSNARALEVVRGHGVRALTDVSGFGLLGHLGEMLRAGGVGVTLQTAEVPLLPGAEALVAGGAVSSLQRNNELAFSDYRLPPDVTPDAVPPALRLLVDPQTSGGLLAAIPPERAESCVAVLQSAGYRDARRIGVITERDWCLT